MIVGEYEQRAVYKRYNVVDNGPTMKYRAYLKFPVKCIVLIIKYNGFSMGVINQIWFAHTPVIASVIEHT